MSRSRNGPYEELDIPGGAHVAIQVRKNEVLVIGANTVEVRFFGNSPADSVKIILRKGENSLEIIEMIGDRIIGGGEIKVPQIGILPRFPG